MKILLLLTLMIGGLFDMAHAPRFVQGGYTAADFWTQHNSVNPRMTLFVLVTPQSFWTGVTPLGFTSNTRDMTLPGHAGVTFKSSPGLTPTVIEQILGEPTNLELTGIYQSASFVQTDVIAGKWNFAEIEIFSASWQNTSLGELVHFKGNLGEFKDYQQFFTAEGRGLIARFSNDVNQVTQKTCRVKEFGDATCAKVLTGSFNYDATADVAGAVVTETSHGMTTGETVRLTVVSGAINPELAVSTSYWIIRVDANTFKFATSYALAVAGTGVTLSDVGGEIKVWRGVVDISGVPYDMTQTGVTGSPSPYIGGLIFNTSTWAGTNPPPVVSGNDPFANGKVTCTSGSNNGISREIAAVREATGGFPYVLVNMKREFPFEITGSETFTLRMGCKRTLEDCRKYQNIVNFRGEPYVPGNEAANRIPPAN